VQRLLPFLLEQLEIRLSAAGEAYLSAPAAGQGSQGV